MLSPGDLGSKAQASEGQGALPLDMATCALL